MIKIIKSVFFVSLFSPLIMADYSPNEFESMYPAKCFEIDNNESTINKSSYCRMRRLRFYRIYLSRNDLGKTRNIAQTYSMIKIRESLKDSR